MIALDDRELATIREHGRQAYPEECCGALLGRMREAIPVVEAVLWIPNIREDARDRRFLVDPRDYLALERAAGKMGLVLLGFYHSHPDHPAAPSEFDRQHAWPNLHYLIVAVASGEPAEMTCWLLSEDRSMMESEPILPRRRTA